MTVLVILLLTLLVVLTATRMANAESTSSTLKAAIVKQVMDTTTDIQAGSMADEMLVHEGSDVEMEDGSNFVDTLLAQSNLNLRFDCGSRNESACEQKYCVYYNGQCMVSPAGVDLSCKLYCGSGCTPSAEKKGASCSAKVSSYFGLCPAFKEQENCDAQTNLCEWRNDTCEYVESCCALALDYCLNKKHKHKALKVCTGQTNGSSLCSYAKANC